VGLYQALSRIGLLGKHILDWFIAIGFQVEEVDFALFFIFFSDKISGNGKRKRKSKTKLFHMLILVRKYV